MLLPVTGSNLELMILSNMRSLIYSYSYWTGLLELKMLTIK